jgi:hypothetical protein
MCLPLEQETERVSCEAGASGLFGRETRLEGHICACSQVQVLMH